MRPSGYDTNGNCEFAIPLSSEFSNKDECVKIIDKYIGLCLEELTNKKHNSFDIKNINEIKEKIPHFYDIHDFTFMEAYTIHNNGVCFCLMRHTYVNGWKHSIAFYSYDEMSYFLDSNLTYSLIISKFISDDEKYNVEHKFDQEIINKGNNKNNDGLLIFGSNVYAKIKNERVEKVKKQNVSQQPSQQQTQQHSQQQTQQSSQSNVNVNQNNVKQRKTINCRFGRPLIIEI